MRSWLSATLLCIASISPLSAAYAQEKTTVRVVAHAPLRVLDPIANTTYISRNHGYFIYDTLFGVDEKFNPQLQMLDKWSLSRDKLTYTFTLRSGLKFHDGSPVTSQDCIASLKRWGAKDQVGIRMMAAMKEMAAVDDTTFKMVFKEPFGATINALANYTTVVPFIMPARIAATPPNDPVTDYIGSGPFVFMTKEFQPGAKAVYEKFKDYRPRSEPASGLSGGKVVNVDRVEYLTIPDQQTATNALLQGEVEYLEEAPIQKVEQLKRSQDVVVQKMLTKMMYTLRFNWLQPPFNDVRARQAVLHAISQEQYLYAQVGNPAYFRTCGSIYGCDTAFASEVGAVQTTAKPDLQKAKSLLASSGYAGDPVVVIHISDVPLLAGIAPTTVQALRSIGMKAELKTMDWGSYLPYRNGNKGPTSKGGWSITSVGWANVALANPLSNLNLDTRGEEGYAGWSSDKRMAELKDQFERETDPAKQKEIAQEIQKRNYELLFIIPLGEADDLSAHRANYSDLLRAPVPVYWSISKKAK